MRSATMTNANLDAIYAQIDSLPALPATASAVLEVTADPESSAHDLMNAILPDQSMCTTILKIANSAFFGLPREVNTIEKAVMVLGFDEVKNIVLGKAVFNSFKELDGNNQESIEKFWQHSFSSGLAAKIIAERIDISASEMFIAGLIHDIGKLAMLLTFPNIYSHLLKTAETSWRMNFEKENELFFISHDDVARRILNRWLFPERLVNSIGYHHRPKQAEAYQLPASCLELADIIAHIYHNPDGPSAGDRKKHILDIHFEAFDIWQHHQLPCSSEEVQTWFELLSQSHEKDNAILSIFASSRNNP